MSFFLISINNWFEKFKTSQHWIINVRGFLFWRFCCHQSITCFLVLVKVENEFAMLVHTVTKTALLPRCTQKFRFTTVPLSLSPGCRNLQDIPHVQPPEQRKVKISTAMVKSRQTKSLKFTKVAWKVLHLDSFWQRGTRELGNGLFMGSFFGLHSACFSLNYHVRSCVQFSAHCK